MALLFVFFFSAAGAQVTDTATVLHSKDSVITPDTDATSLFFKQGEKTKTPDQITVVTKTGKAVSLSRLLKNIDRSTGNWVGGIDTTVDLYVDYVFSDLDADGKNELVIFNYTGGAHCCDEIYIYKNMSPGKYQYVVRLFGGHTIITAEKKFEFSFDESFGYFFTCFACGYTDTSDAAPIDLRTIILRYARGKITVAPGDQELRSIINDNLGKLGEQAYEKLDNDALAMDGGLRKAVAMNLAVFYYSFGRNIPETKKLFSKYYKYPDARVVWNAFIKNILAVKKDSDF
ncbi:MAG: hypothetical protein SGI83_10090 [Bacteroidota bacterium]|nr:hypothetical protein [Bacteroidota bacterium]